MKKKYILSLFLVILSMMVFSQSAVLLDANNGSFDASAIFEVRSTNKGILIPRMTSLQRAYISSPANGLLIFDTDIKKNMYYDDIASAWKVVKALPVNKELLDTDNDSKIQVEENTDEDIIRFDIASNENFVMEEDGRLVPTFVPYSVLIGFEAGKDNNGNSTFKGTLVGYGSGKSNSSGSNNTALGYQSMMLNTTKSYNVAIGNSALQNSTGENNTAIGIQAGLSCGDSNVFIGFQAGALETGSSNLYIDNSWNSMPLVHGDFHNNLLTVNGTMSIGTAPYASTKLSVFSNSIETANFFNLVYDDDVKILHAEYTNTGNYDAIAIAGQSQPNPNGSYGYGAHFVGNYMAVKAISNAGTSVGSSYGVYAKNYGTAGMRYGIYGEAEGGSYRYGVYGKSVSTSSNHYAMYCDGNGVYTGTWLNSSDKKLKKNIQPIQNALEKLTQLVPSTYQFKTDEYSYINLAQGIQFGFIAQEIETVFPELVSIVAHPKGHEKETDIEEFKAINYIGLIPVLTQAIKEQQFLIDKKQELIESLTKRLEIIEHY